MEWSQSIIGVLAIAVPVILAITFHEAAHGFVAWRLGDDTAYRQGRVTFNPLRHVDAFGTVLLPAILLYATGGRAVFGWAKPVPVNFSRLRNPRRDMIVVAAAGPGTNLLLAVASAYLIHFAGLLPEAGVVWLERFVVTSIVINCFLAVFNMLPLPPLDGGRVAVGLLPESMAAWLARLEPYGLVIIIVVVFVLPVLAREVGIDFSLAGAVLVPIIVGMFHVIGALSGVEVGALVCNVTENTICLS